MRRPTRLLLYGVASAATMGVLSLARPLTLAKIEHVVYDVIVRAAPVRPPSDRVVIVDIDEDSLAAVGQWPWPHAQIATLIGRLRGLGASVIALDVIFAEPERFAGGGARADANLIDTIATSPVVLGYAFRFDQAAARLASCVEHPLGLALIQGRGDATPAPLFRATGAVCNLPDLTRAAPASGFLNAAPDPDGILRRVPLLVTYRGRTYPSLALAAVTRTLGTDASTLRPANAHASSLDISSTSTASTARAAIKGREVPLDAAGNLLVRYRGPKRTLRYVSAADVLAGGVAAATFKDKVVFVGTTALGTREVVATPLDTLFSGVEVQATVADNLLQADFIYRPAFASTVETVLLMALSLALTLIIGRWGIAWVTVAASGMLFAVWAGALSLMSSDGVMLSPLYPTLGVAVTVAVLTGAIATQERRRADRASGERATSRQFMVETLLSLTEIRDVDTGQHSRRIQLYTRLLAEAVAEHPRFRAYLTSERIELLARLATLHDIGKVGIPDAVLNKAGALTKEEFGLMRQHPVHGRDVIVNAERAVGVTDDETLALAKEIVYTHHEKWDGTGYPEGLHGTDIPIAGRIVALVDVYDAVVTHRPYRKAMSHEAAVKLILEGSGTHFDPAVADAFLRIAPALQRLSAIPAADATRVA